MSDVPQKVSLVSQTRDVLQRGMDEGRWLLALPGERTLADELNVSRGTLRKALAALERQGLLRVRQGLVSEIQKKRVAPRAAKSWQLGCLLPEPLWKIRPFLALMIDALRMRIQEMGGQLAVYHGARYYRADCNRALSELTKNASHDCWLLVLSTHAMQSWFHRKKIPVIVAGSSFEDAILPSVDFDFVATGRHAAGQFLARGHRRILMLSSHAGNAGIMDSERGLREGIKNHADAVLMTEFHNGTPADVCRRLGRLWARKEPPTAIFVSQSNAWLSASGCLARMGVRTPRDVSLIVGQDESYLSHLVPEPARYAMAPEVLARQFASLVRRAREGTLSRGTTVRLLPQFIPGETLARPALR